MSERTPGWPHGSLTTLPVEKGEYCTAAHRYFCFDQAVAGYDVIPFGIESKRLVGATYFFFFEKS